MHFPSRLWVITSTAAKEEYIASTFVSAAAVAGMLCFSIHAIGQIPPSDELDYC